MSCQCVCMYVCMCIMCDVYINHISCVAMLRPLLKRNNTRSHVQLYMFQYTLVCIEESGRLFMESCALHCREDATLQATTLQHTH